MFDSVVKCTLYVVYIMPNLRRRRQEPRCPPFDRQATPSVSSTLESPLRSLCGRLEPSACPQFAARDPVRCSGAGLRPRAQQGVGRGLAQFVALLKIILDSLVLSVLGLFRWFVSFHAKRGIKRLNAF